MKARKMIKMSMMMRRWRNKPRLRVGSIIDQLMFLIKVPSRPRWRRKKLFFNQPKQNIPSFTKFLNRNNQFSLKTMLTYKKCLFKIKRKQLHISTKM
jgi:hypothetical protein